MNRTSLNLVIPTFQSHHRSGLFSAIPTCPPNDYRLTIPSHLCCCCRWSGYRNASNTHIWSHVFSRRMLSVCVRAYIADLMQTCSKINGFHMLRPFTLIHQFGSLQSQKLQEFWVEAQNGFGIVRSVYLMQGLLQVIQ